MASLNYRRRTAFSLTALSTSGERGHRSKHLCKINSMENLREGEAPAELATIQIGKSRIASPALAENSYVLKIDLRAEK